MALTAYVTATNRLLQNPVPATPLFSTADLTAYINEGRQQLAGDAQCIRGSSSAHLTAAQVTYPFSLFTTFQSYAASDLAGIQGIISIRQLSVSVDGTAFTIMPSQPWPWFNRFCIATSVAPVSGLPKQWSQRGLGTSGVFGVNPTPSSAFSVQADCVLLPIALVDNTTAEAIPYPFTDAIQFYAAYRAYLSIQRRDDATVMFQRYQQYVKRAVQETSPTVLPGNFQGDLGAQIVSTKQSLTEVPQQGGR